MMNCSVRAVALAQLDQAVEDRLPVPVAGEIVVGDEEPEDARRAVWRAPALDVVGVAPARLAALHVDDRAESCTGTGSRARRRTSDDTLAIARTIRAADNGSACACRSGRSSMKL